MCAASASTYCVTVVVAFEETTKSQRPACSSVSCRAEGGAYAVTVLGKLVNLRKISLATDFKLSDKLASLGPVTGTGSSMPTKT
jgi:hypothetical protein